MVRTCTDGLLASQMGMLPTLSRPAPACDAASALAGSPLALAAALALVALRIVLGVSMRKRRCLSTMPISVSGSGPTWSAGAQLRSMRLGRSLRRARAGSSGVMACMGSRAGAASASCECRYWLVV